MRAVAIFNAFMAIPPYWVYYTLNLTELQPTMNLANWKAHAQQLKVKTFALYLAAKDPRTPWYARILVGCVVAYAFSPIDLLPDFVPVLGYLDDLVVASLGVWLSLRLIPAVVWAECLERATDAMNVEKPGSQIAGAALILIGITLAALAIWLLVRI